MKVLKSLASKLLKKNKKDIFSEYKADQNYIVKDSKPVFVTGAGRSGTHFISEIFAYNKEICSYHLDNIGNPIGDAFEIFSKWYELPVDSFGFLNSRAFLISKSVKNNKRYLESNPLIAFSLRDLLFTFGGYAIVVVRNPQKVIESHYRKGWYNNVTFYNEGIPGFSYALDRSNHYFSRFSPINPKKIGWEKMTRLKKITWMWSHTYGKIIADTSELNNNNILWLYIDKFKFNEYIILCDSLNIKAQLSEIEFNQILKSKPGKGQTQEKIVWSVEEIEYFNECMLNIWKKMPIQYGVEVPRIQNT